MTWAVGDVVIVRDVNEGRLGVPKVGTVDMSTADALMAAIETAGPEGRVQ